MLFRVGLAGIMRTLAPRSGMQDGQHKQLGSISFSSRGTVSRKARLNQNSDCALVPRRGKTQLSRVNSLSRPTFAKRPIEFQ
jgi:hypothetical protein